MVDIVLSSGFLAFGRHLGVMRAVRRAELSVSALCGTSSGAFVGALWAAGCSVETIRDLVSERRPLVLCRPSLTPWRGLMSMRRLLARLRLELPAHFEELPIPFAVGVKGPSGEHTLLQSGPLPEAVVASCAMPWVFNPVRVDGLRYQDGGALDRVAWEPWQRLRGTRPSLVHIVARSAGRELPCDYGQACVVRTPRSGASFFSLGDLNRQIDEADVLATEALRAQPLSA